MAWETVIGLEVHVQLATRSKLFSGAAVAFGAEPNTNACAVDLALPGTLPVLNEQAVRFAVLFGLAIDAAVNQRSVFERKNYFYPDLPKGYQTSQLAEPIIGAGHIDIVLEDGSERRVRIHHTHLEEDAGKSLHEDYHGMTGIDLNRAGTPLIEIVTEPDLRNAAEAVALARKLHSIVTSLGICDGNMAEGSMRFDVNVSVRPIGATELGTRTETKNLNSFRFMQRAIEQEVERQIELIEDGGKVIQETRLYDGDSHSARSMRSKEEAMDYRYFPCPDLLPVMIDEALIASVRRELPELPDTRAARFERDYGLPAGEAAVLTTDRATADYFEQTAAACANAELAANWITGELAARLNREDIAINTAPVSPKALAGLLIRITDGTISGKIAKQVFDTLWVGAGDSADAVIEARGLKQVSDTSAIDAMVDGVLIANQVMVDSYLGESDENKRKKKFNALVGRVMQASKGQANPALVNETLARKLDSR